MPRPLSLSLSLNCKSVAVNNRLTSALWGELLFLLGPTKVFLGVYIYIYASAGEPFRVCFSDWVLFQGNVEEQENVLPRRYSHFNIQHRIINLCQSVLLFFNCSAPFGWCGCLRLRLRLSWFTVTCPKAEGQGNCFFRSDHSFFVYCRIRKTLFVMIKWWNCWNGINWCLVSQSWYLKHKVLPWNKNSLWSLWPSIKVAAIKNIPLSPT